MVEALLLSVAPRLPQFFSNTRRKPNHSFTLRVKSDDYVNKQDSWTCNSLIHDFSGERSSPLPENFIDKKSNDPLPDSRTLSSLLLYYARNNMLPKALGIWDEILNSSFVPDPQSVSELIFIYGAMRDFVAVNTIIRQMQLKDSQLLLDIFNLSISCFGKRGHLDCMEVMIKKMASMGYSVDSTTGNSYVLYYSKFGSLADMETAYGRLKRSRILIEEEAIRAVSLSYIKENKFYNLGRFLHDVGLGRKNIGNLLWNLLLLSYAANFKMKSLQREFVRMVEEGFRPDLNTFNIRALAFSRMSLMWDLHLSLQHMKHEGVSPDLVTYGCIVDAYLDRRLGRNLEFVLKNFDMDDSVLIMTDPLVFEALGKGDFHSSSEVVLEYAKGKDWSYKMLISVYLKKKFRSNQVFWNY